MVKAQTDLRFTGLLWSAMREINDKIHDITFLLYFQNIYFIKIRQNYSHFLKSTEFHMSVQRIKVTRYCLNCL